MIIMTSRHFRDDLKVSYAFVLKKKNKAVPAKILDVRSAVFPS